MICGEYVAVTTVCSVTTHVGCSPDVGPAAHGVALPLMGVNE